MSPRTIEGTWEEIERHKAEFDGYVLRLTIKPQKSDRIATSPEAQPPGSGKTLRARGAYKGLFGGTEALLAEKQADIEREDRGL